MDLLYQRYASPFSVMNGYINTCQFSRFVPFVLRQAVEDKKFNYYIHRVFDKSYEEWCEENDNIQKQKSMTNNMMEATVQESMKILNNFNPQKGEGEL